MIDVKTDWQGMLYQQSFLTEFSLFTFCFKLLNNSISCHSVLSWKVCKSLRKKLNLSKKLKEHVALDRLSWSLKRVCNRLLSNADDWENILKVE